MSNSSFKDLAVLTNIRPHGQATENNRFAMFVLATFGLGVFNTFLLLTNAFSTNSIANRPLPTMVQLVNGKTIQVSSFEGKNRSPQLIKDFTVSTLTKLFNWQKYLPLTTTDDPRHPKVDPGAPIESKSGKSLVPTAVWAASFSLSDKFRQEFLGESIAPLLNKLGILQGQSEVSLSILDLQDPVEVKGDGTERLWKVNIVANLILRSTADVPEQVVPWNKTVYLKAIYPSSLNDIKKSGADKDLAQVIAMAGSSGLQIYAIEKLEVRDTQPMQSAETTTPTPSNTAPPNTQVPAPSVSK
jgi:hypothetical protein